MATPQQLAALKKARAARAKKLAAEKTASKQSGAKVTLKAKPKPRKETTATRDARIRKINAEATKIQKNGGTKKVTTTVYKVKRRDALKQAGKIVAKK